MQAVWNYTILFSLLCTLHLHSQWGGGVQKGSQANLPPTTQWVYKPFGIIFCMLRLCVHCLFVSWKKALCCWTTRTKGLSDSSGSNMCIWTRTVTPGLFWCTLGGGCGGSASRPALFSLSCENNYRLVNFPDSLYFSGLNRPFLGEKKCWKCKSVVGLMSALPRSPGEQASSPSPSLWNAFCHYPTFTSASSRTGTFFIHSLKNGLKLES